MKRKEKFGANRALQVYEIKRNRKRKSTRLARAESEANSFSHCFQSVIPLEYFARVLHRVLHVLASPVALHGLDVQFIRSFVESLLSEYFRATIRICSTVHSTI